MVLCRDEDPRHRYNYIALQICLSLIFFYAHMRNYYTSVRYFLNKQEMFLNVVAILQ